MAVNITKSGGIYIEISGDVSPLHDDLIKAENMGRAAGKSISEALSGAMTAKGAARTANSLTKYMSMAARAAKATTADLSKKDDTFRAMGVSIGVTEKNLGDFISRQRQAFQTQTQKAFLDNLKGIQRLTGATNDEMNRLAKSLGGVGNEFNNTGRSARDFGSCIEGVVKKYAGMLIGVQTLKSTAEAIGEATLRADKLDKAYTTIYDSAGSAKEQLDFLYGVSNDLGLQFQSTAEAAKTFFAAGKGTALEGELNNIFKSFSSAGSALSLSQDEMQGVFLALGQMISKGKVQAEELRGQLGERLPGAFGIAAKAMGVTTAELDKMLATGKITAEDLLPKMAAELEKTFGGKALAAGQGLQGQLNRFTTEWERIKASVVDSDAMAGAVGTVAGGMKTLADNAQDTVETLKGVTMAVGAATAAWKGYQLIISGKSATGNTAAQKSALQMAQDAIAMEQAARNAAVQTAKTNLDAAIQAQAAVAWKTQQIDLIAKHNIGTKLEERAVAALTAQRLKLAAADRIVAAAERELLTAQSSATKMATVGATAANGLKSMGASILGFFGGPVGLSITAATAGITLLATHQTEAEKIAANYGDTMEEVRQRLLGVEDAAQNAGTKIREMSLASTNSERDNLQEKLNNIRKEFKIPLLVFENSGLNFWNYSDIISSVKDIQNAFLAGSLNAKETIIQFKALYAEAVNAGRATPEVSKLFDALEKGVVSVETINVRLDETNKLIGDMSAGFRDLTNAAALARDELKLTGLALDPAKVSKVLDEFQTKIDQAKRTAQGRAVATALMSVGVSNTDIDKSGNVNKDAFALYSPEQKEAITLIQTQARELDSLTRSATTASKSVFQISEAYERTVNATEQLRLKNVELSEQLSGSGLSSSLAKIQREYKTQLDAIEKRERELVSNRAQFAKAGKLDTYAGAQKEIADQKALLETNLQLNVAIAHRAELTSQFNNAKEYAGLRGNIRAVYDAEVGLLNIERERLAEAQKNTAAALAHETVIARRQDLELALTGILEEQALVQERIRIASARSSLDVSGMLQTGMAQMSQNAGQGVIDFWEKTVPESLGSATDTIGAFFADIGSGTKSVSNAFSDMGKTLQNVARQVMADLIDMSVRMLIFNKIASSFGGGSGLTLGKVASDALSRADKALGAVAQSVKFSAKGNVFDAPALSSYSNSIVSSPTIFPFAKGVGMMGEAGAEAIMPLTRTRSGDLGVQVDLGDIRSDWRPRAMSGGAVAPQVNLQVNIENNTSAQVRASTTQDTAGNPVLNIQIIEQIDGALAQRVFNGRSSIGQAIDRTRGTSNARMLYRK